MTTETLPAWRFAEWDGNELLNKSDDYALWSGKSPPPLIGATVLTSGHVQHRATITGYSVVEGWLMADGFLIDDPARTGNLAGVEILRILED